MSKELVSSLSPGDIERFQRFRIPVWLLELHGIRRATTFECRQDFGIHYRGDLAGVVVPVWGADGEIHGYRVRRDNPDTENGEDIAKYVQSKDKPRLFFECSSRQYLSDASVPVIFVEAYSSALAIAAVCERTGKQLLIVATAGCWGWKSRRGTTVNENGARANSRGSSSDLDHINFTDRKVFICFDTNRSTNPQVQNAEKAFTRELQKRDAIVHLVGIPTLPDVNGPDDFLINNGDPKFLILLDEAKPAEKIENPFRVSDAGVFRRIEVTVKKNNKDEESGGEETEETTIEWRRICSRLEIDSDMRDVDNQNWGRVLLVYDRDHHVHQWAMPMSLLAGDGVAYRETLLSMGLEIESGKFAKEQLQQYISSAQPDQSVRCVSRCGWHKMSFGMCYVLPDRTFGAVGERVLLQSPASTEHRYRSAGTLEEWQDQIGALCVGNSRLVFAVSAAFAAPLMTLVGEPGGGVNFRGKSSSGKTTALHVAGSVCGGDGGANGYLRTWRATSNGLEAVAEIHNDGLMCLDELSQVDGREAGEIAYMLANGIGKSRARRDGSSRNSAQWRTQILSTGEISLSDKMAETGKKQRAGQDVRIVDLPADAGRGLGVFENLHGIESADLFAKTLLTSALKVYGTPIQAYLEKLAASPEPIAAQVRMAVDQFLQKQVPSNSSGQVHRVARRFALIAAGGTLAAAMGILPWPEHEAAEMAAVCFKAWLESRGTTGDQEVLLALRQVRRFFEQHGESRFTDWKDDPNDRPTVNRAGFRKTVKHDAHEDVVEFYVTPEVFKSEICAGFDPSFVSKILTESEFLITTSDGKPCSLARLPGVSKPTRVYHFSSAILGNEND